MVGDNPGPRRGATLNLWKAHSRAEPSLLLFGGVDADGDSTAEAWAFDLKNSSWKELSLKKGPEPRHAHAAVFHEKTSALYVFGGQMADGTVLRDAYALKGSTDATYTIRCCLGM